MRLITGASGMIGRNLAEYFREQYPTKRLLTPTHKELDLTDAKKVREYLKLYKPDMIIHCASNDDEICLYDNLRMFVNLAESKIPMITFSTGRDVEDRPGKVGEYILSKYIAQELALHKYYHITVLKIWGCFGKYEKPFRFLADNMRRIKNNEPIVVRENRMFSYVYVKDLARIVDYLTMIGKNIHNVYGYTASLFHYAYVLHEIAKSPYQISVEKTIDSNYIGREQFKFEYTPLRIAIKEVWDAFNNSSV